MKSANVQVFNPTTLKVITTIPADKGAHNVTFSRDGKLAFIANVGTNNVTIIDAVSKKALGNVPAGTRAHQVAVSPDGKTAVVCNPGSGDIRVHHDLGSTVPFTTGGTAHAPVARSSHPYD